MEHVSSCDLSWSWDTESQTLHRALDIITILELLTLMLRLRERFTWKHWRSHGLRRWNPICGVICWNTGNVTRDFANLQETECKQGQNEQYLVRDLPFFSFCAALCHQECCFHCLAFFFFQYQRVLWWVHLEDGAALDVRHISHN